MALLFSPFSRSIRKRNPMKHSVQKDTQYKQLEVIYQNPESAKEHQTSKRISFYYNNLNTDFSHLYDGPYLEEVINHVRQSPKFLNEIDIYLHYYNPLDAEAEPIFITNKDCRRILILISDETYSVPRYLTEHFDAVFKNFLWDPPKGVPLFPLPSGYSGEIKKAERKPTHKRTNDVFYAGRIEPRRHMLYRALSPLRFIPRMNSRLDRLLCRLYLKVFKQNRIKSLPNSFLHFSSDEFHAGPLNSEQFNAMMMDSKIALCPRGRGVETFRHIEAARAGCVIFSDRLPPHHFYEQAPFVYFDSRNNLLPTLKEMLLDREALEHRQSETLAWWDNTVNEASVARYIVEKSVASILSASHSERNG